MNIKITVIVSIYNLEDYLKNCIDSIVNQTYKNLEIILVDDGSLDSSGVICDEYAKKDQRIIVIHKDNGGPLSARKAGVEKASGNYISFVDGDDWIDFETYKTILNRIKSYNPDMITFGLKKHENNSLSEKYNRLNEGLYSKEQLYDFIKNNYASDDLAFKRIIIGSSCTVIYKTSLIKKCINNINDSINVCEDGALNLICLLNIDSLFSVHYAPYHYMVRKNSIMHSSVRKEIKGIEQLIKTVYNAIIAKNLTDNLYIMNQYSYWMIYTTLISNITDYWDNIEQLYSQLSSPSKIVLYGNGVFGEELRELIEKEKKHKFVRFVNSSCIDMLDDDFDYIIISITFADFVSEVNQKLIDYGVPDEKILYLTNDSISYEKLKSNRKIMRLISDI